MGNLKQSKKHKKQFNHLRQIESEKQFRRYTIYGFLISLFLLLLFYAFVVMRCETLFLIRSYISYGNQITPESTCLAENKLKQHNTLVLNCNGNVFYVCGCSCAHFIEKHYMKNAFTTDAVSGDTILKSNAIIGLKERGDNKLVYFESQATFNKYYAEK